MEKLSKFESEERLSSATSLIASFLRQMDNLTYCEDEIDKLFAGVYAAAEIAEEKLKTIHLEMEE